ncbi:MAG: hypothetical protein NC223_11045 [Butyrivibrio sp.]|nr:hypothetical protein [Butyrivibrio sp.]
MRRYLTAALLMGAMALFTGCADSNGQYVDLESIEIEADVDLPEEDAGYDGKLYYDSTLWNISYNGRYIYGGDLFWYTVDMSRNTYSVMCARVGCDHFHDDRCELRERRSGIRYYDGGVLYVKEDSLYYRSSYGQIKKLHTNIYSTEFSRNNYPVTDDEPWAPREIYQLIFLNEKELLIFASNYVYTYNLESKRAGEPIEICDSIVFGACVNGNEVYSYNMNGEAYLTSLVDGTSKRILEQGRGIKLLNGRLWYAVWAGGVPQIRSNNVELTDERVEVENGSIQFTAFDEGVIYIGDSDAVMLHTFDGEDRELLSSDELTYTLGNADYEYICAGISSSLYIDGKLYVLSAWNGYSEDAFDSDFAYVWHCVENGEITELTEE